MMSPAMSSDPPVMKMMGSARAGTAGSAKSNDNSTARRMASTPKTVCANANDEPRKNLLPPRPDAAGHLRSALTTAKPIHTMSVPLECLSLTEARVWPDSAGPTVSADDVADVTTPQRQYRYSVARSVEAQTRGMEYDIASETRHLHRSLGRREAGDTLSRSCDHAGDGSCAGITHQNDRPGAVAVATPAACRTPASRSRRSSPARACIGKWPAPLVPAPPYTRRVGGRRPRASADSSVKACRSRSPGSRLVAPRLAPARISTIVGLSNELLRAAPTARSLSRIRRDALPAFDGGSAAVGRRGGVDTVRPRACSLTSRRSAVAVRRV